MDALVKLTNQNVIEQNSVSFWDYKINYNRCLGSGVFGTVYEVVKRPEEEKGYLSYLCPYAYDFIFPVNENEIVERTNICIKISKTALRILFENMELLPLRRSACSFFQSSEETKTNLILQKYELSKIKFYKTDGLYSQFKTLVNGKTFRFYFTGGYFTNPEQYKLRKSFACFLNAILNPKISFEDMHDRNIMYDELESRWEIVDGYIYENKNEIQNSGEHQIIQGRMNSSGLVETVHLISDNITELLEFNLRLPHDKITQYVFGKLSKVARKGLSYKKDMDQKLLKKINLLNAENHQKNEYLGLSKL